MGVVEIPFIVMIVATRVDLVHDIIDAGNIHFHSFVTFKHHFVTDGVRNWVQTAIYIFYLIPVNRVVQSPFERPFGYV